MGTYLSIPVLEKSHEEGESFKKTKIPLAWGVVDMQGWRKTMEDAHVVETDVVCPNSSINAYPDAAKVFAVFDGHGGAEVARFCQLYLVSVLTNQQEWKGVSCNVDIGKALVNCFHELDSMLNNSHRRDEITGLKLRKPNLGEKRSVTDNNMLSVSNLNSCNELTERDNQYLSSNSNEKNFSLQHFRRTEHNENINFIGCINPIKDKESNHESLCSSRVKIPLSKHKCDMNIADKFDEISDDTDIDVTINSNKSLTKDNSPYFSKKIFAASDLSTNELSITDTLSLSNNRYDGVGVASCNGFLCPSNQNQVKDKKIIVRPAKIINGRQVCNLPDHPVNAGCTSICAVIVGEILTVANAGDSRAVLCRAGCVAEPLSFDHKPLHEIEMKRIIEAGGFVNHFGRVNGNLNLSRSIGDLKYKQTPGLPPSAQIITAEPDIIQLTLLPNDEFIILACDGVWDCLSNEEAVSYVYEHIDSKTPTIIGIELLDKIVSPDPRASQGIGGDNMTFMVIDLLPQKRSYRYKASEVKSNDAVICGTVYLNEV